MIHLERVALPHGLRAVAYRDKRGNLVIYVSETLDAACQRAAVVEAIRASRRTERRRGPLPGLPSAGIVLLLGIRSVLWRAAGALKVRPVALGAAATTAAVGASAAAVFITAVPHHPPSALRPEPSAVQPLAPQHQPSGHSTHQAHAAAAAAPRSSAGSGRTAASGRPRPAPTSSGASSPTPTPTPSSSPSPAPTQPTPRPSPSPSDRTCIVVLGLRVCLS